MLTSPFPLFSSNNNRRHHNKISGSNLHISYIHQRHIVSTILLPSLRMRVVRVLAVNICGYKLAEERTHFSKNRSSAVEYLGLRESLKFTMRYPEADGARHSQRAVSRGYWFFFKIKCPICNSFPNFL